MELLHLFFIGNLWVSPRICFYSSMIFFIPPNVVPDAVFLHRRKELIGMIAPPSQLTMSKSEVFCEKKPKWRDTTKRYRWVTQKAKSSFCHHIPAMFQMFQFLVIPPAPPPGNHSYTSKPDSSFPWLPGISPPSEPRTKKKHGRLNFPS